MKKITLLLISSAIFTAISSQVPSPLFHFKSNFFNTSLSGIDSVGQPLVLHLQGSSPIASDLINGYPAVKFDTTGFFTFQTDKLLNKDNALFLIVYQSQTPENEIGLWSLQNDSVRKKFLTSTNVGDHKSNVRYKYFVENGANVTTNFVHFEKNDTTPHSAVDTVFVGKVSVINNDSLKTIKKIFFNGKLAEFLIITDDFTEAERQVWQSFLALKYGVTMYKGNYLNSAGDTLWYYAKNQDFSDGVGGIGRDDSLNLKQNFSTISGDSVKISLHNYIDNQQQTAQTLFQNGEYIFWGHNEQEATLGSAIFPVGNDFYYLFNRIWKIRPYVQNQYLLDLQINMSYNQAIAGQARNDGAGLKIFVSSTPDFYAFETQIFTPQNIDNQKVTFSNLNFTDSVSYFTFGYTQSDVDNFVFNNNSSSNSQNGSQNPVNQVFTEADWQPNPVVENLYIDYKLTRAATVWFSVHSNGSIPLCQTPAQNLQAGENQTIIPMGHLPTGTYTVYVHVDDMALMQVIIKR
jgi:hypothetical protein